MREARALTDDRQDSDGQNRYAADLPRTFGASLRGPSMYRLANYDIPARFSAPRTAGRAVVIFAFGLGCALLMIGTRSIVDIWLPGAGPFALVYPAVMLSALYGRWESAMVTFAVCFLWAWWWILPETRSFTFETQADASRVAVNAACGLITILFAEIFRVAVQRASEERDLEIERRIQLMAELGHRTKNNFALVASLLHTQRRRETDRTLQLAFDTAIGRVQSFAHAYEMLSDDAEFGTRVAMDRYIQRLLDTVAPALFAGKVAVDLAIEPIEFGREKAVAVGLVCNEALTNAAKYAFVGRQAGEVSISLTGDERSWVFEVADNGVGMAKEKLEGLGSRLLDAFSAQADARLKVDSSDRGTRVVLKSR
ncbi:DUF4118 domain-containing protein [Sphingomonas sabuli]|uniref:histidine kinase n=1 Tax=Sphingomonas sabuli TaxID=2764186 RepID=A0A7G9L180_9SPHN|nr:histidine kinase dimerization/phosphoacceptor domain -containing protein [Sphingomonas sabuli]QNM82379.1 DUF4118 domain-containing protein [Sphingomonas sabuli]